MSSRRTARIRERPLLHPIQALLGFGGIIRGRNNCEDDAMLIEQDQGKELVHTRQITCRGYRRKDSLWQIEASVADEKAQAVPFNSRPAIVPGELIHHFSLTLVIDDECEIRDAAAKTLAAPWPVCTDISVEYRKLVGLRIGPGFSQAVRQLLGGTQGCTHLSDLLVQVGNTYMQASFPDRMARQKKYHGEDPHLWPDARTLAFVDGCHAWRKDGPVLAAEYPQLAQGASRGRTET